MIRAADMATIETPLYYVFSSTFSSASHVSRVCAFRIFMCNLFTATRCLDNKSESVLRLRLQLRNAKQMRSALIIFINFRLIAYNASMVITAAAAAATAAVNK